MYRLRLMTCLAVVSLFSSNTAAAAPIFVGLGAFAGPAIVDFNSIDNESSVSNQYAGQGVTFSGALRGLANSGDLNLFPNDGGATLASNWAYSQESHAGLSFSAVFSSLQQRVGFYLENWPDQTATIELFRGATSLGTLDYATGSLTAEFLGVEELSGFDRIVFTNSDTRNGFFAIDGFRFEGSVPEPMTLVLLGAGLAFSGVRNYRRRLQSRHTLS